MRRIVVLLALIAVACSNPSLGPEVVAPAGERPGTPLPPVPISSAGSEECDQVLSFLQSNALEQVTSWGWGGRGVAYLDEVATAGAMDGSRLSEAGFSTTNVQEAGIDEPDLIKTNGELVVAIAGTSLHVLDARPRLRLLASLDLAEISPQNLFLRADRAVVMGWAPMEALPMAGFGDGLAPEMIWQPPATALALIDLSDPTDPAWDETITLSGNLTAARLSGESLWVVLSAFPERLPFVTPDGLRLVTPDGVAGPGGRAEAEALRRNRAVIINSSIEDWFPRYRHQTILSGQVSEGPLVTCDGVAHPEEFSGLDSTTIVTFDLDQGLTPIDSFGLAATAQTVYASPRAIYVATQRWLELNQFGAGTTITAIHRFDTSDPDGVEFTGTGTVPGWLYSQWALSEDEEGNLRVASTTNPPWGAPQGRTESTVSVLAPTEGALEVIGSIGRLGIEEQIYAVRFLGDLAYVVTFRQVDPLYVIDLSDPRSPEMAGALKIPGYSAYLHPVGGDLLVGVGQDADPDGRVKGTQVALFDISDPSDPVLVDKLTYRGAYSEAEWDHHAFLYWEPTHSLVVPLQWVGSGGPLAVTLHPDRLEERVHLEPPGYALRNLVVGERLLSLTDLGVAESDLADFEQIGFVRLP